MKIKKQYKQDDGTIIEVEGEEWEIENYEKKQQKKNENARRKKEILHGKTQKLAARELARSDVIEEFKKFIRDELSKIQAVREVHHWYYNNGYWWRPWYSPYGLTYLYSSTNPVDIDNDVSSVYNCSSAELSSKIGLVESSVISATGLKQIGTSVVGNTVDGVYRSNDLKNNWVISNMTITSDGSVN